MKHLFKKVLCCGIFAVAIAGIVCFYGYKKESRYIKSSSYAGEKYEFGEDSKVENDEDNMFEGKKIDGEFIENRYNEEKIKESERLYKKRWKIYKNHKDLLVLVNRTNPLGEDYDADLIYICNGRLQASSKLYENLTKMFSAASKEGYKYWIASAYRSRQKQQSLVDEDVRAFMNMGMSYEDALEEVYKETMPAGCSEHETGLALDILCTGNTQMDKSQEDEPGNKWLRENCHRYGFILRYPKDKEKITGVNYEPWHFRYVGKEAADFIKSNNMTLEEFFLY